MSACSETWNEALSAYFDGEVGALERQRTEAHVATCAACAAALGRFGALRGALRSGAPSAAVPAPLEARVRALAARRRWHAGPARRVAAAAAALLLVVGLLWTRWPHGLNAALAADLERHHLKAFSRATPCEFESSDPEAVRAWAEAQVGYAVRVPAVPGATLLGARRCRLAGRVSISLLYRHGEHALTVFAPAEDSSAAGLSRRFADDGPRCTRGPVGERICVAVRGEAATIAVSELEDAVLLGVLAQR